MHCLFSPFKPKFLCMINEVNNRIFNPKSVPYLRGNLLVSLKHAFSSEFSIQIKNHKLETSCIIQKILHLTNKFNLF